jgi:hypothetical protein
MPPPPSASIDYRYQAMKLRWRSLLLRLFGLAAAAVLGLYLLLPSLIERQIKLALREMGVHPVSLKVGMVTPSGLRITHVTTPDGRLTVGRILVGYSLASLRAFRVEDITVLDARLTVAITPDGEIDLGPLSQLKLPSGDPTGPPPLDTYSAYVTVRVEGDGVGIDLPLSLRGYSDGTTIRSAVALNLRDQNIQTPDGRVVLKGINGYVGFDGTSGLTDPAVYLGRVQLRVAEATVGAWPLGAVDADFHLDLNADEKRLTGGHGTISLDSNALGKIVIKPASIDLKDGTTRVTVNSSDLRLDALASRLDSVTRATGMIEGELQLRLKLLPPYRAYIDGGRLVASPGTVIRFRDAKPLQKLLGVSPGQVVADATGDTKRKLVEALQDFRYDNLRITFVRQTQDVVTRIEINGRSNRPDRTEVGPLTLNVGQINDLVNTELVDTAMRLPSWLEDAMKRWAERSATEGSRP